MTTLDATTAGRTAPAGVARPRVVAAGGRGLGMYPCAWRLGVSNSVIATSTTVTFADAISHKAWRPTEHSP